MALKRSLAWEKSCIETLIEKLKPSGEVLEIGFDLGYSADSIQSCHPKRHVIIESDPKVAAEAKKWASKHQGVEVIEESWQKALPKLHSFDLIFFNDFKPEREVGRKNAVDANRLLIDKGQELVDKITKKFPQIRSHKYADSDLESFYLEQGKDHPKEFVRFLRDLQENKQITSEQIEKITKKHNLPKSEKATPSLPKLTDPAYPLLNSCLKEHLKKQGSFACFSSWPLSKYESREFFDEVITNAYLEFEEQTVKSTDADPFHALTFIVKKLS